VVAQGPRGWGRGRGTRRGHCQTGCCLPRNGRLRPLPRVVRLLLARKLNAAERPFAGFGRRGAGEIDGAGPKRPGLSTAVATAEEASPNKAEVDGVEEGHGEGEGGG
jgi:hypothetical protein